MKQLAILSFIFSSIYSYAQINFFSGTLDDAFLASKKSGKPIFISACTSWSEPCENIEKYTFSDLEVSNYYNTNFINVKLDMEEYPGIAIAEEYDIRIHPTLLFLDKNGMVIHRGCGAMDAAEFLDLGKSVSSEKNWAALEKEFEKGNRSSEFLISYLAMLDAGCLNVEMAAQDLLREIPESDLINENSFDLIEQFQWDIFSREFQYVVINRELFEEEIGTKRVNDKIYNTFFSQYQEIYQSEELHLFGMKALLNEIEKTTFSGSDTLTSMMMLHYSEIIEDWDGFAESAIDWVGMSQTEDPEELSDLAWKFYLFVDRKEQLRIALSWAKSVVDAQPSPSSIDTYASILFKLGDKKKAIALEREAIEMASELGENLAHYQHQLSKFEKN